MSRQCRWRNECVLLTAHVSIARPVSVPYSEALCSSTLTLSVEHECMKLVQHVERVTAGTVSIHQMTLYFKVDTHFTLCLLLCTNVKFRDPEGLWKTTMSKQSQRDVEMRMVDDDLEKNIAQIRKEVCIDNAEGANPLFKVNPKQKICATCHS